MPSRGADRRTVRRLRLRRLPDADRPHQRRPHSDTRVPRRRRTIAARASGAGSGLFWAAGGAAATAGVYTLSGAVKRRFGRAAKKK